VPSCSATHGKAGKEIESEKNEVSSKDPKEETKEKKKTERKRERNKLFAVLRYRKCSTSSRSL